MTKMNKPSPRKCRHIRGRKRNGVREEDEETTSEDHPKEVVSRNPGLGVRTDSEKPNNIWTKSYPPELTLYESF